MFVLILILLLTLPSLVALLAGAFSEGRPGAGLEFSLKNLEVALSNAYLPGSFLNTMIFASLTATLVATIGAFIAWVIERTNSVFAKHTQIFALIPILIPAVTLVSAWIMLLNPSGGMINLAWQSITGSEKPLFNVYSFSGMIWIATLQELPLAVLWLWPAFRAMNPELEEAARMAGASNSKVLFRITLPILRPALLGAWIIFFIYSLGALSVPILIGLPSRIFLYATEIYLASTRIPTQYGLASLYSLFFLFVTIISIAAYYRLVGNDGRFATVQGKSFRPRKTNLGPWRIVVDGAILSLIFLIAILPISILIWNAFMPYPQLPSWEGLGRFTTANFVSAYNYGPAMNAIWNSLWIGILAGVITTGFGAMIAWLRLRSQDSLRIIYICEQIAMAPIAIPGLIIGVSLLWFWLSVPLHVYGTPWILLIAYVILHLPYSLRIVTSGIMQLHAELEEAGRISGASPMQIAHRIVLPLIAPTLTAAVIYTSLRCFREYSASLFLTTPGTEIFSVVVLDMWQGGNTNILSAYSVMVMILLATIIVFSTALTNRVSIRD
jgi:iron(III) transport system permease protein